MYWDFLLNHYNSPLSATGNTIYFQNFESIPSQWSSELLAAIEETGLARRVRLIFSCSIVEGEPVPASARKPSEQTLEEVIRDVVQQTVAAHGGNRAAAARQLGISRTTLWRYMEKIEQKQQTVENES